jgi:hypothetical protein
MEMKGNLDAKSVRNASIQRQNLLTTSEDMRRNLNVWNVPKSTQIISNFNSIFIGTKIKIYIAAKTAPEYLRNIHLYGIMSKFTMKNVARSSTVLDARKLSNTKSSSKST